MCINEHMGFNCRTRKHLVSSIDYAILSVINIVLEERRGNHDSYDTKCIAHARRSCRRTQGCKIYSIAVHQFASARSSQGRRSLSSEARSSRSLHQRKYHVRRQKIKLVDTSPEVKDFTAANSPPKWLGPRVRSESSNPLPMYMIHSRIAKSKTVLSNMARGR